MTKYIVSKPELVLLILLLFYYIVFWHFFSLFFSIACRLETDCISNIGNDLKAISVVFRNLLLFFSPRVSTVDPFHKECLTCSLFKSQCSYYDATLSPNYQHVLLNCRGNISLRPKTAASWLSASWQGFLKKWCDHFDTKCWGAAKVQLPSHPFSQLYF